MHVERAPRPERFRGGVAELAGRGLGSVPPPLLVIAGTVSVQVGSALARQLFAVTGALGAVSLRLGFAAVLLLAVWRPSLRLSRRAWTVVIGYGLVLAGMNVCFYEGIARVPLGLAVTIEFLGPLTVALLGSRRWLDAGWALLAAGGVVLLTEGSGAISWLGVLFILGSATLWGCYILLGAKLGEHTAGGSGLALAMTIGGLATAPLGITAGGANLLHPMALAAGLGVALLSSVVPYSVELEALRRMPPKVFGVLMSLEPAVAALAGLLVLGQVLHPAQWAAIGLVVAASAGATRFG
ncbi:MAG TPA: EamA family transporter [Pseudonocardiaceae bacterium]|nr:EamA family transporter [Pseudonocardiaceae bacterium]